MRQPAIVYFDGHCRLCSRSVRWIIRNDRKNRFSCKPLQESGNPAHPGVNTANGNAEGEPEPAGSVLLDMDGKQFGRSSAVLRIALGLRFPWPLLGIFFLVPRFIRDALYDLVARNRKRWFGEEAACYIP